MKNTIKQISPMWLYILFFFMIHYGAGIRIFINTTNSLPGYIYLYQLGTIPRKGDLVTFKHPKFLFLITKRVVGLSGDKVSHENKDVLINDEPVGAFHCFTSKGEPLVPIDPQIIPQNHWFVLGSHTRSHDSRYASFGLITTRQIEGAAWRLF